MLDWNMVVSVRGSGYKEARRYLKTLGRVERTDYYNVLALKVDDGVLFLDAVKRDTGLQPELKSALARVIPVRRVFVFQNAAEFEARVREAALDFVPDLAQRTFHVRMHRRGFRGQLASQDIERKLARLLLERLEAAGTPGHVRFDDPDCVLVIETLGQRAGLALVTREQRARYPFLEPE
jgi:tRNA(Ser,Leu) C12 N-acetylase TAN1